MVIVHEEGCDVYKRRNRSEEMGRLRRIAEKAPPNHFRQWGDER
jgi:hypothetical protein